MFSVLVVFNLMIATLLTAAVQARISHQIEPRWQIWVYLFIPVFATLSFAMNGRLSYMMLGISMMLYAYTRWLDGIIHRESLVHSLKWFGINGLALVFLSVSSGCFTVGMLLVLTQAIVLTVVPGQSTARRLVNGLFSAVLVMMFIFLQYTYLQKNLEYYGGSIYTMVLHGLGEIFTTNAYGKEILAVLVSALVFVLVRYFANFRYCPGVIFTRYYLLITPVLLVIIASAVGMFGYSALLTGSTAAMILTIHGISVVRERKPIQFADVQGFLAAGVISEAECTSRKIMALVAALGSGMLVLIAPEPRIPPKNMTSDNEYKWILRWEKDYQTGLIGSMNPVSMASDTKGNVFIVESNHRILRIDAKKNLGIYAGDFEAGDVVGVREAARFNNISDIAADKQGNLYVADQGNNKIKKIDTSGYVSTILGNGKIGRFSSGCKPLECRMTAPRAVDILPDDSLVVSAGLQLIRLQNDDVPKQFLFVKGTKQVDDGRIVTEP
ncbi:MAG: hypothetical protein ACK502_01010 [Alphaproteobacteria bacterium]